MKGIYFLLSILLYTNTLLGQWQPVGDLLEGPGYNDHVRVMLNDTANNRLIIGGRFTGSGMMFTPFISAWNGESFEFFGEGFNGPVNALCIFNDTLYAGGEFTQSGSTTLNHIARWNGTSWEPVGNGFNGKVNALIEFNGFLYAGGDFSQSGGDTTRMIARWVDGAWDETGNGLVFTGTPGSVSAGVKCFAKFNNQLYVGGRFNSTGSGAPGLDGALARWNGFFWTDIPNYFNTSYVSTLKVMNQHLFAGGGQVVYLHEYDGSNWLFGDESAFPNITVNGPVYTFNEFDDRLVVGGAFTNADLGQFSNQYVLGIENQTWIDYDGGLNNSVFCSEIFQGDLYVGGAFSATNQGQTLNFIARRRFAIRANSEITSVSCFGENDGSVSLIPQNGTPPYTYEWTDNGSSDSVRTGLTAAVFSCIITDASGRTGLIEVNIPSPWALSYSTSITGDAGDGSGAVELIPLGGTPPYTVTWQNGTNGNLNTNLVAGFYPFTIVDQNGCSFSDSVEVPFTQGLDDQQLVSLQLYPNPSTGKLNVRVPENSTVKNLLIYNGVGQLIWNGSLLNELDFHTLSKGAYLAVFTNEHQQTLARRRFMLVH